MKVIVLAAALVAAAGFAGSAWAGIDATYANGGPGDDYVVAPPRSSQLDGGGGVDAVDFSASPGGISVALAAGTYFGFGGPGTLGGFANVVGSPGSDHIVGDDNRNTLRGGG